MHAVNKVSGLLGHLEGRPAHLLDIGVGKSDAHLLGHVLEAFVSDGRTDAIEPGALVAFARHGEGSAAKLFRVQTKRRHLQGEKNKQAEFQSVLLLLARTHLCHLVH